MSWQRAEQNGWLAWLEGLPQVGHGRDGFRRTISADMASPIWGSARAGSNRGQGRSVEPVEVHGVALAGEQTDGLVEGQTDDRRIGAHELDHKGAGDALDGVAAGLVAPFGAGEIGFD